MAAVKTQTITPAMISHWTREDKYHNSFLLPEDSILDAVVKHTFDEGVEGEIAVSPAQGKFLNLLAKSIGAKRFLEVGTLGGWVSSFALRLGLEFVQLTVHFIWSKRYSAVWVARALAPGGHVVTFELEEHHAKVKFICRGILNSNLIVFVPQVARENFKTAGVADKITVVVGPATETLPKYQSAELFDIAFIDADKESNLIYFTEAKRLIRKGGVIVRGFIYLI